MSGYDRADYHYDNLVAEHLGMDSEGEERYEDDSSDDGFELREDQDDTAQEPAEGHEQLEDQDEPAPALVEEGHEQREDALPEADAAPVLVEGQEQREDAPPVDDVAYQAFRDAAPEHFLDLFSQEGMVSPHLAADGHSYERERIR